LQADKPTSQLAATASNARVLTPTSICYVFIFLIFSGKVPNMSSPVTPTGEGAHALFYISQNAPQENFFPGGGAVSQEPQNLPRQGSTGAIGPEFAQGAGLGRTGIRVRRNRGKESRAKAKVRNGGSLAGAWLSGHMGGLAGLKAAGLGRMVGKS
jgi:hypothetical protein